MRYMLLLAILAPSCAGDVEQVPPKYNTGDDDDVVTTTDSGTWNVDPYFEPLTVGFEYQGGVLSDGTLSGYRYPDEPTGTGLYVPYIQLIFTSLDYFDFGDPNEACIAVALLDPPPAALQNNIPATPFLTGGPLFLSYEFALVIDPANSNCFDDSPGGKLDPAEWGPGGTIDLLDAFNGARFGLGFGPLSEYIEDGFRQATLDNTEFMEAVFSEYIALNDAEGNWTAVDWSVGILYEWNEVTREVEVGPNNTLTYKPLGAGFPDGYIQSDPSWYQDFPLLDFSNLKEGAPSP